MCYEDCPKYVAQNSMVTFFFNLITLSQIIAKKTFHCVIVVVKKQKRKIQIPCITQNKML